MSEIVKIECRRNRSRHMLVVIEGLSGSGKTTVAKMLAGHIGGVYIHGPPVEMEALRDLVEKPGDRIRPLFYALGNALCSRSAENILKKSPVVIDRYVYTTIAWHHAMGIDGHLPWGDLDLLQPDVAFLLTVEERSRHNRLHSRSEGLSTRDVRSLTGEAFVRQAYLENLRSYDFVEIDTSSLEPDHVVERMLQHIPVERRLNLFE